MTKLGTVLIVAPLCSALGRLNGELFAARGKNNLTLIVQWGPISWRLRVDEVMTKLGTVPFFVPLSSTLGRLNGKLLVARGRKNLTLIVQRGSISWRLRVDEVTP